MNAHLKDDGVDPLDAFMASEINPEVRAKEAEEAKKREEELKERAKQRAVCYQLNRTHLLILSNLCLCKGCLPSLPYILVAFLCCMHELAFLSISSRKSSSELQNDA